MIGTRIGSFRIDAKLGEGGMGVVYRATDTELDRVVALKTLISASDEESVARFLREAKAASRLQHPSIVTIYHFGVHEGSHYIVMEFIEGKTLKKIISGKPMPVIQLCELALQVTDALAAAHEKGVVHRDMKAENVMVTPRGQVKILDFGLAKLKEREDEQGMEETAVFKTQAGLVVGTVSHMSPEQAMGADVDARSDIFSMGVVLYEMATGVMPFDGPSAQGVMAQILRHNPAPITQLNPEAPPELERLVEHCLQKDRMLRPTAQEVVFRLKNIQASLSAGHIAAPDIRNVSGVSSASGMRSAALAAAAAPAPSSPSAAPASAARVSAASAPAVRPVSSRAAIPAAVEPAATSGQRAIYLGLKTLRVVLSLGLLAIPFSFLAYFVISGGLIKPQFVEGTAVMGFMRAVVVPALEGAEKVFTFRAVYQGWNFMLLAFAAAGFLLRQLLLLPVEKAENWAKTKVVRAKIAAPVAIAVGQTERRSGDRLSMLREYAEAKKMLFQEKRRLAVLSIDVAGASRMKAGQDKLVVEHAFSEYRKYVERALEEHNAWKHSWTADGVMAAFNSPDDAAAAAQSVLAKISWFNDGVHQLSTPFQVKCGLNVGEFSFPENKRMDEITDETIDVALGLQSHAPEGALWITRETFAALRDQAGYKAQTMEQVDGHAVIEWRPTPVQ